MEDYDPEFVSYCQNLDLEVFGILAKYEVNGIVIDGKITFLNVVTSKYTNMAQQAAVSGNLEIVKAEEINDYIGNNEFIAAAREGHLNIVEYCLDDHTILEMTDAQDMTALENAAKNGHLDVVKYLVDRGAEINTENYPILLAGENGHLDVMKYLIERGGEFADDILSCFVSGKHYAIVEYLLEHNLVNIHADEALRKAVESGDLRLARYLFKYGAHIPKRNYLVSMMKDFARNSFKNSEILFSYLIKS